MPEQGQYPEEVGYYEGGAYQPATSTNMGGLGRLAGQFWEDQAMNDIYRNMTMMQGAMDDTYQKMAAAQSPVERQFHEERIIRLRQQYQGLVEYAQTGAAGMRALPALAQDPGLISDWQGLKEGYPGGFNVTIPLQLTEPGQGAVPAAPGEGGQQQPAVPVPGTTTDVGLYGQTGLDVTSPLASQKATTPLPPTGLGVTSPLASAMPPPQPFQPTAAGTAIPNAGVGGLAEGAYAGDVIGGQTPFVDQYGRPMVGPGGGGTYDQLGGGTINAFEGPDAAGGQYDIPGVQTPGGRGFANYYDLYQGMGGGQTRPWSAGQIQQDIMKNQFGSQANSLREMLNPLRGFASGRVGAGAMYRGLMTQRADLGQGVQDYQVRRDAYGNIRSYTPGGTPSYRWSPSIR